MTIEERLDRIERLVIIGSKEVLNTAEVAMMLNMAVQTIRNMMHEKSIPYYKRGGKAFFKKSEIESWMLQERIPTNDEIKSQAATYIATKKLKQ